MYLTAATDRLSFCATARVGAGGATAKHVFSAAWTEVFYLNTLATFFLVRDVRDEPRARACRVYNIWCRAMLVEFVQGNVVQYSRLVHCCRLVVVGSCWCPIRRLTSPT